MAASDFLVHDPEDNVGVVVVEGVTSGKELAGLVLTDRRQLSVTALDDIPLGHKVALTDLAEGDTMTKYGHDCGRIVAPVKTGGHVHVHNVKTKRW